MRARLAVFSCVFAAAALLHAQDGALRVRMDGAALSQYLGVSVSDAGDVDADGWPDLVVGVVGDATFGAHAGAVQVWSGHSGQLLITLFGSAVLEEYGYAVSAAGDVNLDGYADVLIGAIGDGQAASFAGCAHVVSGEWIAKTALGQTPLTPRDLFTWFGQNANDNFGLVVADCGDVDRDGYPDVVVGAPRNDASADNAGAIRVLSGATGATLATLVGESAGDQLGHACCGAGDVNGDGWPDIVGGAFGSDAVAFNGGMARVWSGEWIARTAAGQPPATPQVLATFYGTGSFDRMGQWVSAAGDANGDGFADVLVGVPWDDDAGTDSGSVFVFSGEWITKTALGLAPLTARELFVLRGATPFEQLGLCTASAGDVDGDGVPDIVAGAPFNSVVAANAGAVRVYSGSDGSPLRTFYGTAAGGQLGQHVSTAGDLNRDGFADLIAGAPFADGIATDSGSAFVYSLAAAQSYGIGSAPGNTISLEWFPGTAPNAHLGIVHAGGAQPGSTGVLALATAPASLPAENAMVLVDIGAGFLGMVGIPFSATGEFAVPLELKAPAFAGTTFFAQVASLSPAFEASNGLLVLFGP